MFRKSSSAPRLGRAALSPLVALLMLGTAQAKDLTIAASVDPVMDPHQQWSTINLQYYQHYYGYLVGQDQDARPFPLLAESYEQTPDSWRFKLRTGLSFDDGTPLTAGDVVASYTRAMNTLSPGSFAGIFNGVKGFTVTSPDTFAIDIARPMPTLPVGLAQVAVLPAKVLERANQSTFVSGTSAVGLGPYRFKQYLPGNRLSLVRNEAYDGARPEWDTVTFRLMPDATARLAALLSGDVDVMTDVLPQQADTIRRDDRFTLHVRPADRAPFLYVDSTRDVSPYVTGPDGEALMTNPFKDLRVRQALTHAIDRTVLSERVMQGFAFPTGQLVPKGFGGYNPDIPVPDYNPVLARKLLAEAGWPKGFRVRMHCTEVNSTVCQAIAQMFARVSVKVDLDIVPRPAYWPRMTDRKTGGTLYVTSWGASSSGEANVLETVIRSNEPGKNVGMWNLTHYSNPSVDALVDKILVERDDAKRHAMQAQAMKIAMDDVAVLPLYVQAFVVAARKDLDLTMYANGNVYATAIRSKR